MRKTFALAFLIVTFLGAASAPQKEPPKTDKELFQGEWTVMKAEMDGKEFAPAMKAKMTFKDDKLTLKTVMSDEKTGSFKLDPDKKPKEVDLTNGDKQTALAIYKFEDEKIILCMSEGPGAARPKEFKSAPNVVLIEMTRVKKP